MSLDVISSLKNVNVVRSLERLLDNNLGISTVRGVEWDRKYLWLMHFEDDIAPEPFKTWFPANSAQFNMYSVGSEEFTFGQSRLSLPTHSDIVPNASITFYDDVNRTLYRWFQDWISLDILNNGQFISGLRDSHTVVGPVRVGDFPRAVMPVRNLKVAMLDLSKQITKVNTYSLVIEGGISQDLSHVSEATEYTVTFKIVGDSEPKVETEQFGLDIVRDLLGRII
jgi:hypothetical protein